jgi:hypothetical protein
MGYKPYVGGKRLPEKKGDKDHGKLQIGAD